MNEVSLKMEEESGQSKSDVERIGRFQITQPSDDRPDQKNKRVKMESFSFKTVPEIELESSDSEGPTHQQLALFTDENEKDTKLKGKSVKSLLALYGASPVDPSSVDPVRRENTAVLIKPKANLSTIMGVYLPCLQNIFGVIYFVRLYWIVGVAGALDAFAIVFSCCMVSLLTSLSMSAIATNGKVSGGGTYFMISRSLGPEFGGSVGMLFYLGISISVAMYLIGSIEILLKYIAPQMALFDEKSNNVRLLGSLLLTTVLAAVFLGVKFVSRFALIVLSSVIVAILSVYIGIFVANPENSVKICFLGKHLLSRKVLMINGTAMCSKDVTGPLHKAWCNGSTCDFFFKTNEAVWKPGIPGLSIDLFKSNLHSSYGSAGRVITTDVPGSEERGEIITDITTSFVILLGIYFPSITGFEQGSSYSGDLKDAQKSIPLGTLAAVFTSSFVCTAFSTAHVFSVFDIFGHITTGKEQKTFFSFAIAFKFGTHIVFDLDLTTVLMFAGTVEGSLLRDKYGVSIDNQLIMSQLSWPTPWVILIGALMSTVGAGLQALTAPRLLNAVAKDNLFPLLDIFARTTKNGEPFWAIGLSAIIAESGILIAQLDHVAPIVTMFFLLCYGFVNFACALQSFLHTHHWRPRFYFYHWSTALLGMALCIVLMFLSQWIYALLAILLAFLIYKYIEFKGAEKEWGDGMRGLSMSAARYALLHLNKNTTNTNTKNWRPQLLMLVKVRPNLKPVYPQMLSFASFLKAGKGLTMVCNIIEGDFFEKYEEAQRVKKKLYSCMDDEGVKGFTDVVVSTSVREGIIHVIQNTGLGGLYPNTVMVGWPLHWPEVSSFSSHVAFTDILRCAATANMATLVLKGLENFPSRKEILTGTIDVWWIMIYDGSLLILLPFLLKQDKVWRHCELRIFTIAQRNDNSIKIKDDLRAYLYNLRIPASVEVVEMEEEDISAYTYERTLMMEERSKLLSSLNLNRKQSLLVAQNVLDLAIQSAFPNKDARKKSSATDESPRERQVLLKKSGSPLEGIEDNVSLTGNVDPLPCHTPKTIQGDDQESDKYSVSSQQTATNNKFTTRSRVHKRNMKKMHTAVLLNRMMHDRSQKAELVIINMPALHTNPTHYINFLEELSSGLSRVLMVRGTGREVITMYS